MLDRLRVIEVRLQGLRRSRTLDLDRKGLYNRPGRFSRATLSADGSATRQHLGVYEELAAAGIPERLRLLQGIVTNEVPAVVDAGGVGV